MLNVSFYLLTPTAKSKSNLYVSISDKYERLRFSTKYSLLTDYCNKRGVKGSKDLLKKNSEFYPEYSQLLVKIRNKIIKIGMELKTTNEKIPLEIFPVPIVLFVLCSKIDTEPVAAEGDNKT